jgi:hypothetical protein
MRARRLAASYTTPHGLVVASSRLLRLMGGFVAPFVAQMRLVSSKCAWTDESNILQQLA